MLMAMFHKPTWIKMKSINLWTRGRPLPMRIKCNHLMIRTRAVSWQSRDWLKETRIEQPRNPLIQTRTETMRILILRRAGPTSILRSVEAPSRVRTDLMEWSLKLGTISTIIISRSKRSMIKRRKTKNSIFRTWASRVVSPQKSQKG